METKLFFVAMQVFRKDGAFLVNEYMELPAPFYPEYAKSAYMKKNPGTVMRRDLILVINWADMSENKDRHDWQMRKDAQHEQKRSDIRKKAGDGGFGEGDAAATEARKALAAVYDQQYSSIFMEDQNEQKLQSDV